MVTKLICNHQREHCKCGGWGAVGRLAPGFWEYTGQAACGLRVVWSLNRQVDFQLPLTPANDLVGCFWEYLQMHIKSLVFLPHLLWRELSFHQLCCTKRNQRGWEWERGIGLIIVSFNLHVSFWSFQILVLYYPDNICVLCVQLPQVFIAAPSLYMYFLLSTKVKLLW